MRILPSPIRFIRWSVYFNCPFLTAVFLALFTKKINKKGDYTVLCLERSIFIDDVKALSVFGKRIQYVFFPLGYLNEVLYRFIKKGLLNEADYHRNPAYEENRRDCYLYINRMFPLLRKFIGFDAVLSANVGYINQQEFCRVCEDRNVPFIVLHKEGVLVPGHFHDYAMIFKPCKFTGAKVLLYNDDIKKAFLDAGIDGMSEDKLCTVGVPRLDFYFRGKDRGNEHVLFLSFAPENRFAYFIEDKKKIEEIETRTVEFHKWVIQFAIKHPNIKVIIKTKKPPYYFRYAQDIRTSHFRNDHLDNLVITNSGDIVDLILNARAVIGLNSTASFEAIASDKVVIAPYFGDIITNSPWDCFVSYPELLHYAKTSAELDAHIMNADHNFTYDPKRKESLLRNFVFNTDGCSSMRAEEEIVKTIRAYRKR